MEDNLLLCKQNGVRIIFFPVLDGVGEDTRWGRFQLTVSLQEEASNQQGALAIHVITSNSKEPDDVLLSEDVPVTEKEMLFQSMGEKVFMNNEDFLLYDCEGRYLWFYIEVIGERECKIKDICIHIPGDNFMNSYPQVYREWGSFFHRYLSVFSSIYNDFHNEIKTVGKNLNPDTAPLELLPVLARWMGIDVSGDFLKEEALRILVKEGYYLCRMKGTGQAIERITEIVLGEKAILMEKGKWDVVLFINQVIGEKQRFQLVFLLKQFIPIRCMLKIVYLYEQKILDTYCFLDMNAVLYYSQPIVLDYSQITMQ